MEKQPTPEQNDRPSIGDEIGSIESNQAVIEQGNQRIGDLFERFKNGDISRGEYDLQADSIGHEMDLAQRAMSTSEENVDRDITGKPFTVSQKLARFARKHL